MSTLIFILNSTAAINTKLHSIYGRLTVSEHRPFIN